MRGGASIWGVIAVAVWTLLVSGSAHAKRVALVVGVSAYQFSPPLANPSRDATSIAKALRNADFEVLESVDPDLFMLSATLDAFYAMANGAEAALFFYAGHGVQFEGTNYLVPTDAALKSETRLKLETIALQDIITALEKRASVTLVFLDACRDNSLAMELQRSANTAKRSFPPARGLAPVTVRNPDTYVVFAAAAGKTASDGNGSNSPFTTALLQHLTQPGVEIELTMKRVARDVLQATNGEQRPERWSQMTTEFMVVPVNSPSTDSGGKSPVNRPELAKDFAACNTDNNPLWCLGRSQ